MEPIANELAKKQKDISVAEFFSRNRHLLGFDNPKKALLTTIKEAVDNSLDACEEADVLPEINIEAIDMGNNRFKVIVEDNGPGIVKQQIPKVFAKLLYGSKFFKLSQSRGQQGIGISASVMYGQLTTGRPAKIVSKISKESPAVYYELHINTQQNKPEIVKEDVVEWEKEHGTKIEIDLEAMYQKGLRSVDSYLKHTAVVNPHATIFYTNPEAQQIVFPRVTDKLPSKPVDIKPHPYGVELGRLISMLKATEYRTLQSFLSNEFSRVGNNTAKQICENAALLPNTSPSKVSREMAEKLMAGIEKTKLMTPPTDCISPIGEELVEKGLRKEINAEFYCAVSRKPSVYRGNPFLVEVGIAYGGDQKADSSVSLMRFANRVPLLYQQSACSITKSVAQTSWRAYGLSQSNGALPVGPCTILVHIASVWVPFTSESKEAIAHYPEIIRETKLALQEAGRKLASYVNKKTKVKFELKKRSYIEKYIPHISDALKDLVGFEEAKKREIEQLLEIILEKERGKLDTMDFNPDKNVDFDEDFANIGKVEEDGESTE
ncbi:MAG: DNA topoisomerase VI subunit B [Candidatus Woesearchaeota archaeon]